MLENNAIKKLVSVFFAVILMTFCVSVDKLIASSSRLTDKALCGPYSLKAVCDIFGMKVEIDEIIRLSGTSSKGTSMKGLANAAYKLGLQARGMRVPLPYLIKMQKPVIAYVKNDHFLVVVKTIDNQLLLLDNGNEPRWVTDSDFEKMWDGYILAVSSTDKTIISGANIQIIPSFYDFGKIDQGQKVKHKFLIKNTGRQELTIKDISKSCNCSKYEISNKVIPSGETAILELEYNSQGYWGRQSTSVMVYSNDPDEPVSTATMTGIVVTEFVAIPKSIDFGNISNKTKVVRRLEIFDSGTETLAIKDIELSSDKIKAKILEQKRGEKAVIAITIQPGLPLGAFDERLTIYTTDPKNNGIKVPLYGMVIGPIRVIPDQLFMGVVSRNIAVSKDIELVNLDESNWKITKIEKSDDEISVKIIASKPGPYYNLRVTFHPNEKTYSPFKGSACIYTDSPEQQFIEVKVYALVQ